MARAILRWLTEAQIETALIDPGKPWQNTTDEWFNGRQCDEYLSLNWFRHRVDAKVGIEQWRRHYNEVRPHPNLTKSEMSVHSKNRFPMLKRACIGGSVTLLFGLLVVASGCGSFLAPTPPPPTAEAYCASSFASIGYGNFFYCGTVQGNLEIVNFPDGSHGYCMSANTNNLGLVGYSAYTYSGGASPVESQSDASALCSALNSGGTQQCPGYIRCTRQ